MIDYVSMVSADFGLAYIIMLELLYLPTGPTNHGCSMVPSSLKRPMRKQSVALALLDGCISKRLCIG